MDAGSSAKPVETSDKAQFSEYLSLQSVEETEDTQWDVDHRVFHILKATLEFPASAELKGAKLAQDIVFVFEAAGGDGAWDVWNRILEIVQCAPPHHAYHDSLLEAIKLLHVREGPIWKNNDLALWKNLPDLSTALFELHFNYPPENEPENPGLTTEWKNLHSFASRLAHQVGVGGAFSYELLRDLLEEPLLEELSFFNCHLWVVCTWLVEYGEDLFAEMVPGKVCEDGRGRIRTGSLCPTKQPLSRERWDFWKKRLSEIADEAKERVEFNEETLGVLSKALKRMEELEQ